MTLNLRTEMSFKAFLNCLIRALLEYFKVFKKNLKNALAILRKIPGKNKIQA